MLSLPKYVLGSTAAASLVVYHAFSTREQFFPAVYYLSSSKVAIAVLGNLAFAVALCLYHLTTRVFLGALRESEVERINDRISQAVMETCLAMTIFRDEFNVEFVAMFTILTFIKVFHWLIQDRVDFIETTPTVSRWHHVRIISFMLVLLSIDSAFLQYTVSKTLKRSASVHLLFGFEYIIQASIVVSVFLKYTLSVIDNYLEGRWENKGVYVFYLELITDMLHLLVYLVFFIIVFTNYGLPLHLVRDLYWTFRNFRNRVSDFLRYRRVTANMDQRFLDATAEDLARCDNICIICREDMQPATRNKRLNCGHVFHMHCLRSWLERQQNCPICRTSVFSENQPPADGNAAQPAANQAQAAQAARPQQQAAGNEAAQVQQAQQPPAQGVPGFVGGQPPHPAHPGQTHPLAGQQRRGQAQGEMDPQAQAQAHAQAAWAAANYGYMWNPPQWGTATSMALFVPAHHLQYAGQQMPTINAPTSQGMTALPMLPLVFPPSLGGIMPPPPTASAAEHQQHHQALSAAAAAAAAASSIYYNPLMLPPSIFPPGGSRPGGAGAPVMSQAMRQEFASSAAGAVEQAILRSLNVMDQQANALSQASSQTVTGEAAGSSEPSSSAGHEAQGPAQEGAGGTEAAQQLRQRHPQQGDTGL